MLRLLMRAARRVMGSHNKGQDLTPPLAQVSKTVEDAEWILETMGDVQQSIQDAIRRRRSAQEAVSTVTGEGNLYNDGEAEHRRTITIAGEVTMQL